MTVSGQSIVGLASGPLCLMIVVSMLVAYLTADFEAVSSIFLAMMTGLKKRSIPLPIDCDNRFHFRTREIFNRRRPAVWLVLRQFR
jgi:hypothetical protein